MDDDRSGEQAGNVPGAGDSTEPSPLASQAAALAIEVDLRGKALARLGQALKQLGQVKVLAAPTKVTRVVTGLRKLQDLPADVLGEKIRAGLPDLLAAVQADQAARLADRRVSFGRALAAAANEAALECRLITADPMEYALPPFTVGVDLETSRASLRYARLEVAEVAAEPDPILEEQAKQRQAMEADWDPERFFEALLPAYRQRCRESRRPMGERVDLVALLPQVALAFQTRRFRRDPTARSFRDYSRARFAFDLGRLRREAGLTQQGWRLNLGPATGEATRRKENVLYLEEGPGQGQYYQSAWFVAREEEPHREEEPRREEER